MSYKVTYFTFKGLGEPVRFMLAYGNVDFIDDRVTWEEFQKIKPTLPLGQLPILEIDGRLFNQSIPICSYLGDNLVFPVKMLSKITKSITLLLLYTNCARVSQWYYVDKCATDEKYEKLVNEVLPFYLNKLEHKAKDNDGYLALKRITWADVFSVALIGYCNSLLKLNILADFPNLTKVYSNVVNTEGVKKYLASRPVEQIPESLVAIY